ARTTGWVRCTCFRRTAARIHAEPSPVPPPLHKAQQPLNGVSEPRCTVCLMSYRDLNAPEFFALIDTEATARDWLWKAKHGCEEFLWLKCRNRGFYQLMTRPEVRQCVKCRFQERLRARTMLEHSKLPILLWLRAMFLMMQDKNGVSALQLQRQLRMRSY